MGDRLNFIVQSGGYRRRHCPVRVVLPIPLDPLDLPTLHREGRQRPVPCQLEPTPQGAALWWIVENLPAGESQKYVLTTGSRERQPTPKVQARALSPGQFELTRRDGGGLLMQAGVNDNVASIQSLSSTETLLEWIWDRPASQETPWTVPSRGKPRYLRGVVFASVAFDQDRIDSAGVAWSETIRVRLFDVPKDLLLFDCSVFLRATTDRIRLAENDGLNLRCEVATANAPQEVGIPPGWRLDPGNQAFGPVVALSTQPSPISVAVSSTSFGFPFRWRHVDGRVRGRPNLGPDGVACIPLGQRAEVHCRICEEPNGDLDRGAERFFDFDSPPSVEIEPKAEH